MSIMQLTQTIHIVPAQQIRQVSRNKQVTQPTLPGLEPEPKILPKIGNRQIAEVLAGIADVLEGQNGNPYRIQAYRNAARGVLDLQEPAADILARGQELPIAGLGARLRSRIAELVHDGAMTFHNGLCFQMLPPGVRALMAIEHIGPYTAIRLHEELGIDSPEQLWRAAHQQRIRQLPGFGARSEFRLKKAAATTIKSKKNPSLGGAA